MRYNPHKMTKKKKGREWGQCVFVEKVFVPDTNDVLTDIEQYCCCSGQMFVLGVSELGDYPDKLKGQVLSVKAEMLLLSKRIQQSDSPTM